jgi:Phosphotransferase enzyme family
MARIIPEYRTARPPGAQLPGSRMWCSRAREDRDLRCSTWPATASPIKTALPSCRESVRGSAAAAGRPTKMRYVSGQGLKPEAAGRLTAAGAVAAGGNRHGGSLRYRRPVRSAASTAVYHLPAAGAVARIAPLTSYAHVTRMATSVQVTRWLAESGYPAVEPLPVDQPLTSHQCVITFWQYIPQEGPEPSTADLGSLLRALHQLPPPLVALPAYQPLTSIGRAIQASQAIDDDDRSWLSGHHDRLLADYAHLVFELPAGLIHGDAWRGNLLRDGHRAVLADWDTVSTGPRETDLIPTLQAPRFGLPPAQRDAFITAYGRDVRGWDGYPVLRDIRELSTLSALLRDGSGSPPARRELLVRIRSLRTGDNAEWASF